MFSVTTPTLSCGNGNLSGSRDPGPPVCLDPGDHRVTQPGGNICQETEVGGAALAHSQPVSAEMTCFLPHFVHTIHPWTHPLLSLCPPRGIAPLMPGSGDRGPGRSHRADTSRAGRTRDRDTDHSFSNCCLDRL